MLNEAIYDELASASSADEIKSILEKGGCKIVDTAAEEKGEPKDGPNKDGPAEEKAESPMPFPPKKKGNGLDEAKMSAIDKAFGGSDGE